MSANRDWNIRTNMDAVAFLSRAFRHLLMQQNTQLNPALDIIFLAQDRIVDAMLQAHAVGSQEAA